VPPETMKAIGKRVARLQSLLPNRTLQQSELDLQMADNYELEIMSDANVEDQEKINSKFCVDLFRIAITAADRIWYLGTETDLGRSF
jgi:hypothetical protein